MRSRWTQEVQQDTRLPFMLKTSNLQKLLSFGFWFPQEIWKNKSWINVYQGYAKDSSDHVMPVLSILLEILIFLTRTTLHLLKLVRYLKYSRQSRTEEYWNIKKMCLLRTQFYKGNRGSPVTPKCLFYLFYWIIRLWYEISNAYSSHLSKLRDYMKYWERARTEKKIKL